MKFYLAVTGLVTVFTAFGASIFETDFEADNDGRFPSGWYITTKAIKKAGRAAAAKWDNESAHSGKRSVTVKAEKEIPAYLAWTSYPVPVGNDTKILEMSFWVKSEKLQGGDGNIQSRIYFLDKDKKLLRRQVKTVKPSGSQWERFIFRNKRVPGETKYIQILFGIYKYTGQVWFDDIKVTSNTEDDSARYLEKLKKLLVKVPVFTNPVIIPEPWRERYGSGRWEVGGKIALMYRKDKDAGMAELYRKELTELFKNWGIERKLELLKYGGPDSGNTADALILLGDHQDAKDWGGNGPAVRPDELGAQGYMLQIRKSRLGRLVVVVCSEGESGKFYGLQSLKQLFLKDSGKLSLPEVAIADRPSLSLRGIVRPFSRTVYDKMKMLKLNFLLYCTSLTCKYWDKSLSNGSKAKLKNCAELCRAGFIEPLINLRPGHARPGYDATELHYSSGKQLEIIKRQYKEFYDLGFTDFLLTFDDYPFRTLRFEDDKKTYGRIENAQARLADECWKYTRRLNPRNKFYFLPLYCYSLDICTSKSQYDIQTKYLRRIGALPGDISIVAACNTGSSLETYEKYLGRKVDILWHNYFASYEGYPGMEIVPPVELDPGKIRPAKGYVFTIPPGSDFMWYLLADYQWNINRYNPEKSFYRALYKTFGPNSKDILKTYIETQKARTAFYSEKANFLEIDGENRKQWANKIGKVLARLEYWRKYFDSDSAGEAKAKIAREIGQLKGYWELFLNTIEKRPWPLKLIKTGQAPVIDGSLGDACWWTPAAAEDFSVLFKKAGNVKARNTTCAYCRWDGKNLYFAFKCKTLPTDKSGNIKAAYQKGSRDEQVFYDDAVEIFITPPGKKERKNYYHIVVNSKGAVYDAFVYDASWNGKYNIATRKMKDYWQIEMSVDVSSFKLNALDRGDEFYINFAREAHSPSYEPSSWVPLFKSFHEFRKFAPAVLD
jgi:hypothetical protein